VTLYAMEDADVSMSILFLLQVKFAHVFLDINQPNKYFFSVSRIS